VKKNCAFKIWQMAKIDPSKEDQEDMSDSPIYFATSSMV
jgi:hypothetical protein